MPIYEYECPNCQQVFELMRPFSKSAEPGQCPRCGGQGQRVVSVFASKADYKILVPAKDAFRGEKK